ELPIAFNGRDTLETHAWVFSGEYAVCWNGIVYRVQNVGTPADLDQDVRAIVDARPWSGRLPAPLRGQHDPAKTAFCADLELGGTMAPTAIALLLRLGRTDLAAQLWRAPESADTFGHVGQREEEEGLWLATAAEPWFATAYLRLVGAFDRGDDQQAADVA